MKYKLVLLKHIADITMGQSPKSEFYNDYGDGLPFLQGVRTFGDNYPYFDVYTSKYRKTSDNGDILFSVRAPVGRINWSTKLTAIGRGIASIHVHNNVSSEYVYYYLKKIGPQIDKLSNGTVYTSINSKELGDIEVKLPENIDDQYKIANRISLIDRKIELNNQINDNLVA